MTLNDREIKKERPQHWCDKMSTVFVSVGTTRFDELILAVLTPEVQKKLKEKGYDRFVIQYGHSEIPWKILEKGQFHNAST